MAMHQFSVFPLIPTVIKGTNLDKLHDKLVSEGVDYSLFKSGSKISTITNNGETDKLYSDEKTRTLSDTPFTKNPIYIQYLKNQLEIAPDFKSKVIFSTQLRKLIELGLMEGGVATDFMSDNHLTIVYLPGISYQSQTRDVDLQDIIYLRSMKIT